MNYLTCPQGYFIIKNINNCQEYLYPGYYLRDDKLKKFSKNCLTFTIDPETNSKGEASNMNCDSCVESKGFNFFSGTKNLILAKIHIMIKTQKISLFQKIVNVF